MALDTNIGEVRIITEDDEKLSRFLKQNPEITSVQALVFDEKEGIELTQEHLDNPRETVSISKYPTYIFETESKVSDEYKKEITSGVQSIYPTTQCFFITSGQRTNNIATVQIYSSR